MNLKNAFIVIFSLVILLGLVTVVVFRKNITPNDTLTFKEAENESSPSGSLTKLSYKCQFGKNILESLETSGIEYEASQSKLGKLVTSINGVSQGEGKSWLYYVDGKEATISAGSFICQGGEDIRWELK